jgi:hypothetical protein
MRRVQPHTLGVIIGIQFASWHAVWSFLVWIGWAQRLIDFACQLYMFAPAFQIAGFSLRHAVQLTILAACVGYSFGSVAALLLNLSIAEEFSSRRGKATQGATIGHISI